MRGGDPVWSTGTTYDFELIQLELSSANPLSLSVGLANPFESQRQDDEAR